MTPPTSRAFYWQRRQRMAVGFVAALVPIGLIAAVVVLLFTLSPSKQPMNQSTSPDGSWTARAYDHNPGAGGSEWVTVEVVDNSGRHRPRQVAELFNLASARWTSDGQGLLMSWKSNSLLTISGHDVSVPDGYWSN
jgi:hypothetical protein